MGDRGEDSGSNSNWFEIKLQIDLFIFKYKYIIMKCDVVVWNLIGLNYRFVFLKLNLNVYKYYNFLC